MPQTEAQKRAQKKYNESDHGKKKNTIRNWKHLGLVTTSKEEMDQIYQRYLASQKCEKKGCEYTEKNKKHMDHDHETGLFRNILCHACNVNDNSNNTSGTPNIYKHRDGWLYQKTINKKTYSKCFKTFEQACAYKIEYELKQ